MGSQLPPEKKAHPLPLSVWPMSIVATVSATAELLFSYVYVLLLFAINNICCKAVQ